MNAFETVVAAQCWLLGRLRYISLRYASRATWSLAARLCERCDPTLFVSVEKEVPASHSTESQRPCFRRLQYSSSHVKLLEKYCSRKYFSGVGHTVPADLLATPLASYGADAKIALSSQCDR